MALEAAKAITAAEEPARRAFTSGLRVIVFLNFIVLALSESLRLVSN
jgi:hypothetical protein